MTTTPAPVDFAFVAAAAISLLASWGVFFGVLFSLRRLSRRLEPIEVSWRELEKPLKERFLAAAKIVDALDQFAGHECDLVESLKLSIHGFVVARTIQHRIRATDALTPLLAEAALRGRTNRTLVALGSYQELLRQLERSEAEIGEPLRAFETALAAYNEHLRTMRISWLARFLGFTPVEGFRTLAPLETSAPPKAA